MNTNKNMLTRLSTSTVGRALRRIFGDECGQGMMEYVIIAVVIAVACTLAFAYFGKGTKQQVDVMAHGVTGDTPNAEIVQNQNRTSVKKGIVESENSRKVFTPGTK